MIHHVVLLNFKDDLTEEAIKEVMLSLRDLQKTIPEIKSYTDGINCSTENLAKGYTHGFTIFFDNQEDRDAYLVHPDHTAAAGRLVLNLKNGLESVLVFDYDDRK